ncbi:sensor domain-containing diguanylate cyclase [Marinisporobacter balticus]|uniref:Diguanylate cyclase n=1 Tax=Marinisporobacter balticus TaxID=2018667 RepID=A0A4R2K8U9_9FIRM|nr:sensor domain-containing diguanylate cyclase [Marinisporobacter balticus]TCO69074.1 diguanylate cyclase [Marinisporobacter balticus]
MKNSEKYKINLFISIIIVIAFITTMFINYKTYSKLITEDIKNISKLTGTNIYSEINNELIKPVFVSLTMANDSFLKQWLYKEQTASNKEAHLKSLKDYLKGMEVKYDYNSVFLVSDKTNNYYHYNGIHKVINENDAHDKWYYNFINSNNTYVLDVDNDEADNNILTVFVNCRIEDEKNQLMGTTGVGLKMNQLQTILKNFEKNYVLEAFLIDDQGVVQVHTDYRLIEKLNIYDDYNIGQFKDAIIANTSAIETFRFKKDGIDGYLITRYIDELGWYLVIKKDTSALRKAFTSQLATNLIAFIIVVSSVVLSTNKLIDHHRLQMTKMAITDQMTQLPNRRGFNQALNKWLKNHQSNKIGFSVLIYDIDNFKSINDKHGHVFGDSVVVSIGNYVKDFIADRGMIARWGGDEFSGILYGNIEEAKECISTLIGQINNESKFSEFNITISIGLTHVRDLDTVDTIISRADQGLYIAKSRGKNQFNII